MIFLFYIIFVVFSDDNWCKFKIGSRQFDLSRIKEDLKFDLTLCGEEYHDLPFDPCAPLEPSMCPSTDTQGPGVACDTYNGKTTSYYWVGSPDQSHVHYPTSYTDQSFSIRYEGKVQTLKSPQWTRSIEVQYICDPKASKAELKCVGIQQAMSSTLYQMQVTSKHACPISTNPTAGFWLVSYPDSDCSGLSFASYWEPECLSTDGKTSFGFGCDGNVTYIDSYADNTECFHVGHKTTIEQVGKCQAGEEGIHTQAYCTNDFYPDYDYGMLFYSLNATHPVISPTNPIIGSFYFPVVECTQSLVSPYYYMKSTCDEELTVGLYSDPSCTVVKENVVMYPGQIKDLGLFVTREKTSVYLMFSGCSP